MKSFFCLALILLGLVSAASAQEGMISEYQQASDRFGLRLLSELREASPQENVVAAPLPMAMVFTAMSHDQGWSTDIDWAFGWKKDYADVSHMLLPRFNIRPPNAAKPKPRSDLTPQSFSSAEELWMDNTFWYRSLQNPVTKRFADSAKYAANIQFHKAESPLEESIGKRDGAEPIDFWIRTELHLHTHWTDGFGTPRAKDFTVAPGRIVKAQMMQSRERLIDHVKSDLYEAAIVNGAEANMAVILPAASQDPSQVIKYLEEHPSAIERDMVSERGTLEMPKFHIARTDQLAPHLQKLGIKSVFLQVNFIPILGSKLTTVLSIIDVDVDQTGIKATAIGVMGGVIGGICGGNCPPPPPPFHMVVDRPFIFLVRDKVTGAILFAGVVMDPTKP